MQNTENNNNDLLDILGAIELPEEIIKQTEKNIEPVKMVTITFTMNFRSIKNTNNNIIKEKQEKNISEEINIKSKSKLLKQFIHTSIFWVKYILTSVMIFWVLLVSTNFSAYSNIIQSYIYEDSNKETANLLLNSANAWEIKEKDVIYKKTKAEKIQEFKEKTKKVEKVENKISIKQIISKIDKKDINLWISIVPYENRLVIPKIGKNIPLIDIKEKTVESKNKLDNILMKELEDWVVRYPWSAKPWEKGNSFVFGHSSNFPWIAWDFPKK